MPVDAIEIGALYEINYLYARDYLGGCYAAPGAQVRIMHWDGSRYRVMVLNNPRCVHTKISDHVLSRISCTSALKHKVDE